MGQYIGREELTRDLNSITELNANIVKGLIAEKEVGDLLEKFLAAETYINANPDPER